MRHPRRNEVFRDVGSRLRDPHEEEFIEIKTVRFRPDAALLICSDGLSDVLTSAQIGAILESYDGDPGLAARRLVDAANKAGGKDNVSAVFVAGPDFRGSESGALLEFQPRHAITRKKRTQGWWRGILGRTAWLLTGMLLGMTLWANLERVFPRPAPTLSVNPNDPQGIVRALSIARPGDTVEIPPGEFLGPIELKEGVELIGRTPGQTILRSPDGGIAIIARGIRNARVAGLRIVGGIVVTGSAVELNDLDISGARDAGIRIEGASQAVLLANHIHGNPGFGVVIQDASTPRLVGNTVTDNGRNGVEIQAPAKPVLENNTIMRNGGDTQ